MRRVLCLLSLAGLLAACGSSSSGSSGPLGTELSYLPASSPFVMTITTDPNSSAIKNAHALTQKFPFITLGESALLSKLAQLGINYNNDIRPMFGNPVALSFAGTTLHPSTRTAVVVWITKSTSALDTVLGKVTTLQRIGSRDGATIYQNGSSLLARDGATIVFASSQPDLNAALDRHANGGGITQSQYNRDLSGLPQPSLVQMSGSLTQILSTPRAAKARQVPWVASIRGYGVTINASSGGLSIQYRVDTSGHPLSTSQLPISEGAGTPTLAGAAPIQAGLINPAQVFNFAEAAEQAGEPAKYAAFTARQATVRGKTGVDLNSLLQLVNGNMSVASDTHTTMARAAVSNPTAAAQTLSKLASQPGSVFANATVTPLPGGFYAFKQPKQTLNAGVVGNQLVVGQATPAQLQGFASSPGTPASGAQGSVAFRVALPGLIGLRLKHPPSKLEQTILGTLGDITGWASASTSALTGSATLAFK